MGMAMNGAAQEGIAPMASSFAPRNTPILNALRTNTNAQLFAGIVRTSELSLKNLGANDVSFLVARDATCTVAERAQLLSLKTRDAARAYLMDHAFKGQLTILPGGDDERALSAYYFPDAGTMEVLRGRVSIDEEHPFNMPLLSGKFVLISLSNGVVKVGARSTLLHNNNGAKGGDAFELDHCAVF
jgi:hypothetical protein